MPRKTKTPLQSKERPKSTPDVGTKSPVPSDPGPLPRPRVDENGRIMPMTEQERRAYAESAIRALEEVAQMGTPEEQRRDLEELMKALAETRRLEGRVF